MSVSITVDLVLRDGNIDQAASEQAFHSALVRRVAELETEQEQIAEQVSAVFDQYLGKSIGMPALGSMVAQKLNCQPENFKVLSERTLDYVRANAGEGGQFTIAKGKNGGCSRNSDRPAKTDSK